MANLKMSEFTATPTLADDDIIPIVQDSSGENRKITASDFADAMGANLGVKKYVALLTQTGTNAPVATVLENTLGGTVVWSRYTEGMYHATLAGVFTASKTTSFATNGQNVAVIITSGRSTDNIVFLNSDGVDGALSNCSIEIRVYP